MIPYYLLKTFKTNPMKRNSTSTIGALHPIMFFFLVYGISLFLALFVCRAVYFNIHGEEVNAQSSNSVIQHNNTAVAYN